MMIGLLGFGTPELRLNLILSCYLVTALMVLSIQVPITVQRLHDIGKSGWYALVYLVFIGMVCTTCFARSPPSSRFSSHSRLWS